MPRNGDFTSTEDVATELSMAQRRTLVAANILSGMSYRDIAEQTGVHHSTIGRDVKALKLQWYKDAKEKIDAYIGMHSRRLDALLNAMWGDAVDGDRLAVQTVLDIMKMQAELYGVPEENNIVKRSESQLEADESLPTLQDFLEQENVREVQFREMIIAFTNEDGTVDGVEGATTITP